MTRSLSYLRARHAAFGLLFAVPLAGLGLMTSTTSCSSTTHPAAGLMLVMGTDGTLPRSTLLHVYITSADGQTVYQDGHYKIPSDTTLPTTLGIATDGNANSSVIITASLYDGTTLLDDRQHEVFQIPVDRVAELDITFSAVCTPRAIAEGDAGAGAGSTCGNGQTCDPSNGGCESVQTTGASLPTFQPTAPVRTSTNDDAGADATMLGDSAVDDASQPDGCGSADGACGVDASATCGNGVVESGEACDTGSDVGTLASGCSSDCHTVLVGYHCGDAGHDCVYTAVCGNGVVEGREQCDVGTQIVTGCTGCRLVAVTTSTDADAGGVQPKTVVTHYTCLTSATPETCRTTVCGDGNREGTEECDDGNVKALDGCSPNCEVEPSCTNGACVPTCGDGILDPAEACDDGNKLGGDGCSSACAVEPGFACASSIPTAPGFFDVPIVVHDMLYKDTMTLYQGKAYGHPDFANDSYENASGVTTGITDSALVGGVPVAAANQTFGAQITSELDFTDWYRDDVILGTLDLPRGLRIDGHQIRMTAVAGTYAFDSLCDPPYGGGRDTDGSCSAPNAGEGTGGFYPIDGVGMSGDGEGWNASPYNMDQTVIYEPIEYSHNLSFTTHTRFYFTYDASVPTSALPSLMVTGNDDIWIFVDGQLAIDLGGIHGIAMGSYVLNASNLHLSDGHVYAVDVFHAQRGGGNRLGLTLQGLVNKTSVCGPKI